MQETKDEAAKRARDNWLLAEQHDKAGDKGWAADARQRAIEAEKCADSWLYRTFGW